MPHAALTYETAGPKVRLAMDALAMRDVEAIPAFTIFAMDTAYMERRTGRSPGEYQNDPEGVYLDFQRAAGVGLIDQYIPENPLSMGDHGYTPDTERGASTGADGIILDGIRIDSPEAVAEHLERIVFPQLRAEIAQTNREEPVKVAELIRRERVLQDRFGPSILKTPYDGFQYFPYLRYTTYGYANYLMAYAMYPELMALDFALQADLAVNKNTVAVRAILEGGLPRVLRMDHDMADNRGTLVDIRSLDRLWFPHFARSIAPFLEAGVRLLWHCDGNLMEMVPRLIEAGISGFQGFQYECGMDYERICRLRTQDGAPLMVWAGVSVTRTLPYGTPEEVRRELAWLVEYGPKTGLFLGASSSITPGVPWANLDALLAGLEYFQTHGRRR